MLKRDQRIEDHKNTLEHYRIWW